MNYKEKLNRLSEQFEIEYNLPKYAKEDAKYLKDARFKPDFKVVGRSIVFNSKRHRDFAKQILLSRDADMKR